MNDETMDALQPGDEIAVDEQEPIELPESFVAFVDEDGRKMFRIPWGAELAGLSKALRGMRHQQQSMKTGLAMEHWVMLKLAKKRRRKLASASRRRNYA